MKRDIKPFLCARRECKALTQTGWFCASHQREFETWAATKTSGEHATCRFRIRALARQFIELPEVKL